jgi:hypothetical protein
MRLRSVNLGIALTLSLAATAKAEDRSFMPVLDDTAYEAVMAAIGSTDVPKAEDREFMAPLDYTSSYEAIMAAMASTAIDAPLAPEDWAQQAMDLEAASETTGAIPTNPERHMSLAVERALEVPVPALGTAEEIGTFPEAMSMVFSEAEPLPLQAISSFDLTVTADDLPTAPIWDTI